MSVELAWLTPAVYAPQGYAARTPPGLAGALQHHRIASANRWAVPSALMGGFADDFYDRLHVTPAALALGNLVTSQQREITLWNAWRRKSLTLTESQIINGGGIEVTPPDALPLTFLPLQERVFSVRISASGSPVIDARITFTVDGETVTVPMTGQRLQAWTMTPDWSAPLTETLEWLTDLQTPIAGPEEAIMLREAPRRTWEFDILETGLERRLIEGLLYDWSARVWALPIWADVAMLAQPVDVGGGQLDIDTTGRDFVPNGLAMLRLDVRRYELVEVADVRGDALLLTHPARQAWPPGTRVYPVRTAYLAEPPILTRRSGATIRGRARFESVEPCDFPAQPPATEYLGYPVLTEVSAADDDWQASYPRQIERIDGDTGLVMLDDISDHSRLRHQHAWTLFGREAHVAHRQLLYWLRGRANALWVPTGMEDMQLTRDASQGASSLTVAWAGIAKNLRQQPGRRHLYIECWDGERLCVGVEGAQAVDADNELLALTEHLPRALGQHEVRSISWLMLARLASDRVEIEHVTDADGVARCQVEFTAAVGCEP